MRHGSIQISRGIVALAVLISALLGASELNATVVRLNKGTEIKVRFAAEGRVSSGELNEGDSVAIELAESIIMDDSTIVEQGAEGRAVVVSVRKSGKGGKPGYIKVRFVSLQPKGAFRTPDDAPILIEGEVENEGKSKKTCSYIALFGLLVKGGDGEIDKAVTYTAAIAESIKLNSE
jgi:hypothetical protein